MPCDTPMSSELIKGIETNLDVLSKKFPDYIETHDNVYKIRKLDEVPKVLITKEDHGVFIMYSYDITIKGAVLGVDKGESYHGGFVIAEGKEISKDVASKIKDLDTALGRVLQYGK